MGKKALLQPLQCRVQVYFSTDVGNKEAIVGPSAYEILPAPKDASGLAWASQLAQRHRAHISNQIIYIIKACSDLQVTYRGWQTRVHFSSVTGSPAVQQSSCCSFCGLIMPRAGALWFSEPFFHDCYLTFSTGLGSQDLVHIQGWKEWGEK